MNALPAWQEMESEVYHPGRWLPFLGGALFLLVGCVGFWKIGDLAPPGIPVWIAKLGTAVFASLGGAALASVIGRMVSPGHVRHAIPDVLPNVPQEPLIREGAVVHGRLTHELREEAQGWQFRPAAGLWRNDQVFLLGFGIPFLVFFAGLLTWTFHHDLAPVSWPVAALCATTVSVLSGGSVILFLGMVLRTSYRRLSRLSIPHDGCDLELEFPEAPNPKRATLWGSLAEPNRQRRMIPRERVVAVQLCPWKYVVGDGGRETTWAVQGLLVLASSEEATYERLPLLLTGDFLGAARLLARLADALQVPYLFSADAAGWEAEDLRAQGRPPLQSGGMVS
jgi:hypothetical protein